MWALKGIVVGVVAFAFLTVVYLVVRLGISTSKAIGLSALSGLTIHNPLFWTAFVLVLFLACAAFRVAR